MQPLAFAKTDHRLGLYPVVDSVDWIARLLDWGVSTLQLRIKDPQATDLEQQIQQAIEGVDIQWPAEEVALAFFARHRLEQR